MAMRRLGNSDLLIRVLGVGAWAIGGSGWEGSTGPQHDADSVLAVHAALDRSRNELN